MRILLILSISLISLVSWTQSSNESTIKPLPKSSGSNNGQNVVHQKLEMKKKPYHVKLSTKGGSNETHSVTPEEELESCKRNLEAIETKEAFLKSDPSRKAEAEQSGWFVNAEKTKASLRARIKELE